MEAEARSNGRGTLPSIFARAAGPRGLSVLAAITLISGTAMLPAMATMSDHGASVIAFEFAGSVGRVGEILDGWGDAGKDAAWTQLVLDVPFLIGYGFFLAVACGALTATLMATGIAFVAVGVVRTRASA